MPAESQVRTLMEEVGGEVDHTMNYPNPVESLACREQLKLLARVTSSAGRLVDSIFATRPLAAVALMMTIFRYQPSPFCILDEVDAPLDEANIERLTRLLREMSTGTRFIVITHSKKTMEAASAMYGVTMQEPGVSKLVSVKFQHAAA